MTVHPSSERLIREVARADFAPRPPDVLARILERRAAGERVILPAVIVPPGRRGSAVRWVAGLLLAFAGAAAAMPGSPVRRAIIELFAARPTKLQPGAAAPSSGAVTSPAAAVSDTPQAGVSIPARTRPMWVAIDTLSARVRVVLRITDRLELEVRGLGAAAAATFRPREDGISVAQLRGGDLRIDVPRQTSAFSLLVRGVEVAGAAAGRFRSGGSDSLVIIARP